MPAPVPLVPGTLYHVYNRGVNRETLFRTDANYRYFLRLLAHHLVPSVHVYAFALLPNHYHLIVRPRVGADRPASRALSNACNAYARALNRQAGRVGSLFSRPFQRKAVESRAYAAALVRYVHENPARHGFVSDFRAWRYTSYPLLSGAASTRLERAEVLSWYGDGGEHLSGLPDLTGVEAPVDVAFEAVMDVVVAG